MKSITKLHLLMVIIFMNVSMVYTQKNNVKIQTNSILFTADNQSTGQYLPHKNLKKSTAFVHANKYIEVIALDKTKLGTKSNKKLIKNKLYLGWYQDTTSEIVYHLYGILAHPEIVNNGPDSDVLTQIAMLDDFGPGE